MSNLKRNTLALAVAAGMFLPLGAMAFDVTTNGNTAAEVIASQIGSTVTMSEVIEFNADGITDQLVGRSTGYGARIIILQPGVTITGLSPAAGPSAQDWTQGAVSIGSLMGQSTAVWTVTPDTPGVSNIGVGTFIEVSALSLSGVPLTGAVGARVELFDSNTNTVIATANVSLISRANGVALTCDTSTGDTDKKIDVASDANQAPKVLFTPVGDLGEIGSSLNGNGETYFNAGSINIAINPGVTFSFLAGDTVNLNLSGDFDPAFLAANGGAVFLSSDPLCGAADIATSTINAAGTVATFTAINPNLVTDAFVCLTVDGDTQIDSSSLTVGGNFTRGMDVTQFPSCQVLPLMFNGSVVKVFTFNPAGNTLAQSFLRVSNWGNTGGLVTIEGYDDGGNSADSNITFILPAGETLQLNSEDLENGNAGKGLSGAFGDGIGRWRMVVTAEFDNLRVTSLNRNSNTGTVTNLTDADSNGEQALNDSFGN
ncbi:MAG: hypothetical protein U1A22_02415 [Xanthomonadaceae bacterium]|nr:hypothetical protein [Xanthomonadaceae bacterium]